MLTLSLAASFPRSRAVTTGGRPSLLRLAPSVLPAATPFAAPVADPRPPPRFTGWRCLSWGSTSSTASAAALAFSHTA
ncbi:hypothetical protein CLOP_g6671 [Closterium sp. NIES-67]|nr:hypothetical protein CLOP_g17265 [Closterium sp. NIES-67]GJP76298.1 hypothetical protein CLOP_g6671 [Closterium sp. NIES-67]